MARQCFMCGLWSDSSEGCPGCGTSFTQPPDELPTDEPAAGASLQPSPEAGAEPDTGATAEPAPAGAITAADVAEPDGPPPLAPRPEQPAAPDPTPDSPSEPPTSPESDTPAGRAPRRSFLKPLLAGAGVLAVAGLAAAVAFGAGGIPIAPTASPTPSRQPGLAVTGQPPTASGSWAGGFRSVWQVPAQHENAFVGGNTAYSDSATATADSWSVTDSVGDTGRSYWGLDPATGRGLWGGDKLFGTCADDSIGGLVPCLDSIPRGESDWDQVLELVDWRTGKSRTVTKLSDLGISADLNAASRVAIVGGALLLTLPKYPDATGASLGDLAQVVVATVTPDAKTSRWVATAKGCDTCQFGVPTRWQAASNLQHGVLTTDYGLAFDFATGKRLFDDSVFVVPAADGVLHATTRDGKPAAATLAAPDGTTLAVTTEMDRWSLADQLPPFPLRATIGEALSSDTGRVSVTAFDPATGRDLWTTPLTIVAHTTPLYAGDLSFDGQRLILRSADALTGLNPGTGEVLWSLALSSDHTYTDRRTADGTLLLTRDNPVQTIALDPASGAELWRVDGTLRPTPGPDGRESLLQLGGIGEDATVARLVPADRSAGSPTVPADAPACASGLAPVSWTAFAGSGLLLCRQDQRYQVVYPAHADWQATTLAFTDGGYRLAFGNGTQVNVALGGALVDVDQAGTVTRFVATKVWNDARGTVKFPVPKDLGTCPTATWPVSLSTFKGGWLLVCGTAHGRPDSLRYRDGATVTEAGTVTFRDGSYCGQAPDGSVCVYRAPALVARTSATGEVTQHSVKSSFFAGYGPGGGTAGTGALGTTPPAATADDQVRYLNDLLRRSLATRADLNRAVLQVRSCTDVAGAIGALRSVTENRADLLAALDSAPADAIPDGPALVASLRQALTLSRDSDAIWAQWADAEQANGCADGRANPYYRQVIQLNPAVSSAKWTFLRLWNYRIAYRYGVPRLTRAEL